MKRVGLVGIGAMGRGHLSNYLRLKKEGYPLELVAVCDIDPKQFERKDNELNIAIQAQEDVKADYRIYYDFKEMIAKEQLDYVDLPVPTYEHANIAIYAMEHGLHVLSEKPMALTVEECDRMIKAQKRTGKTLMVAQCLRFWPAYETLKEIVDSGRYGKCVSGAFFRGGATPLWSYQNWLQKKELSGGALLDQHVHDVDTINWLFGMPEAVSTLAKNVIPGSGYDAVSTNYFYPDGKVINAMDDWTINGDFGFEMIFRVNFEKGAVILTRDGRLTLYPVGKEKEEPSLPADDGYYREILYFMDCLNQGVQPERCLPAHTRETIRLAWAEVQSADRGGEKVYL